mgnify:CR=1 FL=1
MFLQTLPFEKSLGLSENAGEKLRIENGVLKWKVKDIDNHEKTVLRISFLDENDQIKTLRTKAMDILKKFARAIDVQITIITEIMSKLREEYQKI